jgi:threonine/homoserine/homoserine lactone efflux protein
VAARREWKFVHFLAGCAAAEVALLLILRVLLAFMGSPIDAPLVVRAVALVGAFFLLWFWVRMVVDFVRERPDRNATAWGWALFLELF